MDFINGIEERLPVDRWKADGIHIWPLIRIWLYMRHRSLPVVSLIKPSARAGGQVNLLRLLPRAAGKTLEYLKACMVNQLQHLRACLGDVSHNSRPGRADALFLGDQASRILVEGRWYDRLCEPIMELLAERQLTSFHVEPYHDYRTPRHNASMFIEHHLQQERLRNRWRRPQKWFAPEACEGFGELPEIVMNEFPGRPRITADDINRLVVDVRSFSRFFSSILRRVKPAVGFSVEYYSVAGMAFHLACHAEGIRTVEIPHGYHGELHVAYGRWQRIPAEGYASLPSLFWCWSETEAEVVRRWCHASGEAHGPVIGGNPWLRRWQLGSDELVRAYDARIKTTKAGYPGAVHILLTYEFDMKKIIGLIKAGRADWVWWVRLHPTKLGEREAVRSILKEHQFSNAELDIATDYPLYAILRHVDVHVTECSAVTIEAQGFGVPTVITSPYGEEIFSTRIDSGWAKRCISDQDAVAAVQLLSSKKEEYRGRRFAVEPSPAGALDAILAQDDTRLARSASRLYYSP